MEVSRHLSRSDSGNAAKAGGWSLGTERPSNHPTLDPPVERLFHLGLGESNARDARKAPAREDDAARRDPREVTIQETGRREDYRTNVHEPAGEADEHGAREGAPTARSSRTDAATASEGAAPAATPASEAAATAASATAATTTLASPAAGVRTAVTPASTVAGAATKATRPSAIAAQAAGARPADGAPAVTVRGSDAAAARPLESPATATAAKPAATNGRSAAPRAAEARETAPPPDPEKAAEIFRQLRMQLTPGTRHAVIQLAPEELGRIAIRVSIRDGRVTGEIRAESEETLAILEKHVPELRAALAQTGFEAADFALARHGDRSARSPLAREPIAAAPAPARPSDAPALRLPNTPVLTEERVDLLA